MNFTDGLEGQPGYAASRVLPALLLLCPFLAAYWWQTTHGRLRTGEPPLVPYTIPWLGHGITFMDDINGFVTWVR